MSLYCVKTRSHQRDKTTREATVEQKQIAELTTIKSSDEDHSAMVAQIIEITGSNEDTVWTALHDSNNDPNQNQAIQLILDKRQDNNEWSLAGKKKQKGTVKTQEEVVEEETKENRLSHQHEIRGRSRSGKKSRGKPTDRRNNHESNYKDNEGGGNGRERRWQRQGGRGRGRGGYQSNRGSRRYNNRGRGSAQSDRTIVSSSFEKGFEPPVNESPKLPIWTPVQPDWNSNKANVGLWGDDEVKNDKYDSADEWGTNSWSEPLTETKVFQAQKLAEDEDQSQNKGVSKHPPSQAGHRIDICTLFKNNAKVDGSTHVNNTNKAEIGSSEVEQQSSLFDDSKKSSLSDSRLFTEYDHHAKSETYERSTTSAVERLMSGNLETATSDKFTSYNRENVDVSSTKDSLMNLSNPLPSSSASKLSHNQGRSESSNQQITSTFSEEQQKQATDAVKASLGITPSNGENVCRKFYGIGGSDVKRTQEVPPVSSKIPATAVEMPKTVAVNSSDYQIAFPFQFGAYDTPNMYDNGADQQPVTENSSYSNSLPNQQQIPASTIQSSSVESNVHSSANLMEVPSVSDVGAPQIFSDPSKLSESLRGPPGLSPNPQTKVPLISTLVPTVNTNSGSPSNVNFNTVADYQAISINGLVVDSSSVQPTSLNSQLYGQSPSQHGQNSVSAHTLRSSVSNVAHGNKLQAPNILNKSLNSHIEQMSVSSTVNPSLNHTLPSTHINQPVITSTSINGPSNKSYNTNSIAYNQVSVNMQQPISNDHYSSSSSIAHIQSSANSSINSLPLHHHNIHQAAQSNSAQHNSKSGQNTGTSKGLPQNMSLGVAALMPNQFGLPIPTQVVGAAYPPEMLAYDPHRLAVQSQLTSFYDMPFANNSNPTAGGANGNQRDATANASNHHGKFGRGEPSSPTIVNMMGQTLQQQVPSAANQHNQSMKVTQAASHQPYIANIQTMPYSNYPNFLYPANIYSTMYHTPAPVQQAGNKINVTTAFQSHPTGYGGGYSSTSVNASSSNPLHELSNQFNKNQMTLAPAPLPAAASNNGGPGGNSSLGSFPHNFVHMYPTGPAGSQVHLVHNDPSVGSQRTQATNQLGKNSSKPNFNAATPYWTS